MSGFTFRRAKRENVALLIGLAGGPGSGKTFTAFRLASGMSGGAPFCVIDTEAGRAKHYADQFTFDHGDLAPPFTPSRYEDAIVAADKAGYPVIVVDSASHEWAGEGGLLDMQEAELDRMAGNDYGKRERVKMAAWIRPKGEHKRMLQKLLQVRAHVILCFRAEPKVEMAKEDGKTVIRAKQSLIGKDGWIPIVEKSLPFEATAYFLLLADAPGIPHPIKLQQQHRAMFPKGQQITEDTGRAMAAWASGTQPAPQGRPQGATEHLGGEAPSSPAPAAAGPARITPNQALDLEVLCKDAGVTVSAFLRKAGIEKLEDLPTDDYPDAVASLKRRAAGGEARA